MFRRTKQEIKEIRSLNKETIKTISSELGIPEEKVPVIAERLLNDERFIESVARKINFGVVRRALVGAMAAGAFAITASPALARLTLSDKYIDLDGQKFYPASKAPYSAIVYIDGDLVIAEDPNGKILAQGKSGVDDAEVIQSAVKEVPEGGVVHITSGTYTIAQKITIDKKIALIGSFDRHTHINSLVNPAIEIIGSGSAPNHLDNPVLANLQIYYGGVWLRYVTDALLENIRIAVVDGIGLKLEAVWDSKFKNVRLAQCGSDAKSEPAVLLTDYNGEVTNGIIFDENCGVGEFYYKGVVLNNCNGILVPKVTNTRTGTTCIEINGGYAISIEHGFGTDGSEIKGQGVVINDGYRIRIVGNYVLNLNPAIYIHNPDTPVLSVLIADNTFHHCGKVVSCGNAQFIEIVDNEFYDCGIGEDDVISISQHYNTVALNTAYTVYSRFLDCRSYWNIIVGNEIRDFSKGSPGSYEAFYFYNMHNSVVVGNIATSSVSVLRSITEAGPADGNIIMFNFTPDGIAKVGANTIVKYNRGYLTENSDTATFSGDGTTTDFLIGSHGLVVTDPNRIVVKVTPISNDAIAASPCVGYVDPSDNTKIRVKFASAPASGTNNVKIIWEAEVVS